MDAKIKPIHWIISTLIAAMLIIGSVQALIYPRTEGEKLEKRVDRLDNRLDNEVREIKLELRELNRWLRKGKNS